MYEEELRKEIREEVREECRAEVQAEMQAERARTHGAIRALAKKLSPEELAASFQVPLATIQEIISSGQG